MFLIKQLYSPQLSSTLGENQLDRPFRHTLITHLNLLNYNLKGNI